MKRRFVMKGLLICFLLFSFLLVACGTTSDENNDPPDEVVPPLPSEPFSDEINGSPTLTLRDGTLVVLERLDLVIDLVEQFPAPPETAADEVQLNGQSLSSILTPQQVPARVDLTALQTPIRNQNGRGTCVAFTTVAALEAAYKRERGLTLDLSEQYANHIQKMTALPREATGPNERETQLGAWGGSGIGYQLGWLFRLRFGLPLESSTTGIVASTPSLSYIPWSDYENTNQAGDAPRMVWNDETLQQRAVDAWNLNSQPTSYQIPNTVTLTNFPRAVLDSAVYGVSRVRKVELNLGAIKRELAAGREVAFGVSLTTPNPCLQTDADGNLVRDASGNVIRLPSGDACYDIQTSETAEQYRDGVWRPLGTAWGGHAMLIVGYDDAKQVFIVKNSWGRDPSGKGRPAEADADADGFIEMSYDWMPGIYEAYSILQTRNPSSWNNQQPFLGKWHLETDIDLERADLAAYHLPASFPAEALGGQFDLRIGTLYDDARAYRVNGVLGGDQLTAYFDDPQIDASYNKIAAGTKILAKRLGDSLAGWTEPYGNPDAREPFFATLGDYPEMQAARSGDAIPAPLDFFGKWKIEGAGLNGVIEFDGSISNGTYTASGGSPISGVTLERNPRTVITDPNDACFVRITVPLSEAVVLDGLLFCETSSPAKRALITGITDDGAFYAYRQKLAPSLEILSPSDGSSTPRRRRRVEFRAKIEGFTEAPVIRWESNIDGLIGESNDLISKLDLSFGEHIITATTPNPAGGTLRDSVTITITNDPPTIDIVEPTSAGPFCEGESITFRAIVQDLNIEGNTLPDEAVTWSVLGLTTFGIGKTVTDSFDAGGYNIIARAVDSEGAFAEDSINLSVIDCSTNTPPEVAITSPAADTSTSDDAFAYDGFDDARGMWYKDITLVGRASDAEDGTLTGSSLVWTTNQTTLQVARLGTGTNLTTRIYSNNCFGTWHEITLTVTDSDGNSRTAVRRIFIWTLC